MKVTLNLVLYSWVFFCKKIFFLDAELILSSSYLTYQHWIGFIGLLNKSEIDEIVKLQKPFMLSSLKTGKSNESGISQARWISNERFITGTDNGEVVLYKMNKEEPENMYETLMTKHEHDSLVVSLATTFDSHIALSGSSDSRIKVWNLNDELSTRTMKGKRIISPILTKKQLINETINLKRT